MRALLASVLLLSCSFQQAVAEIQPEYSPYVDDDFPNQVFFGETHLHTSYSADAGFVDTTLGPEEAYRFALGEEITSSGKKGTHLFVGRGRIQWLIENKCVPNGTALSNLIVELALLFLPWMAVYLYGFPQFQPGLCE